MAIEVETLKGIPEEGLREWARVNGCDLQGFDILYAMWLEANPAKATEEPTTE